MTYWWQVDKSHYSNVAPIISMPNDVTVPSHQKQVTKVSCGSLEQTNHNRQAWRWWFTWKQLNKHYPNSLPQLKIATHRARAILLARTKSYAWIKMFLYTAELPEHCPNTVIQEVSELVNSGAMHIKHSTVSDSSYVVRKRNSRGQCRLAQARLTFSL